MAITGTTFNLNTIQLKYKAAAAWQDNDVLAAGEVGFESDTGKTKLGDGTTTWKELAYFYDKAIQGVVDGLVTKIAAAETDITGIKERLDTAESSITSYGTRLDSAESTITSQGTRLTTAEESITSHGTRLDTAEGTITSQGTRLTAAEGNIDSILGVTTINANGTN